MSEMVAGQEWRHMGDGVYARFDGWHVVLRTETAGEIFVDPYVFEQLVGFYEECHGEPESSG